VSLLIAFGLIAGPLLCGLAVLLVTLKIVDRTPEFK
jgi:hypothetical protein